MVCAKSRISLIKVIYTRKTPEDSRRFEENSPMVKMSRRQFMKVSGATLAGSSLA
ncbi:twin-arginine translocation signal domain-containing protein [Pandoraea terrae]|uniref:twin-arginine translocation signal domain-containing protein n=1 Tax=Pandoraea terrae TaxID=1537710 RepID=UPI001242299D